MNLERINQLNNINTNQNNVIRIHRLINSNTNRIRSQEENAGPNVDEDMV